MRDEIAQRVALDDAVAVDADDDLAAGVRDAVVQCVELAAVRLHQHAHIDLRAPLLVGQRAQERLIRRAVVDHDHLAARVIEGEQRLEDAADHRCFIEGGDDDGNKRRLVAVGARPGLRRGLRL